MRNGFSRYLHAYFASPSADADDVRPPLNLDEQMQKLEIPLISERIRGITLPENGILYVCDYDEVFKVKIEDEVSIEVLNDDPYDFLDSLPHSLGINGHEPILQKHGNTISYDFSPNDDFVNIDFHIAGESGSIAFRVLSGDWFIASFSKCGKYLVLVEPYDFDVYEVM